MSKKEIFISWSGERSRQVAEYLQFWLRRVIPSLKPFISTKDVEKGSFWFTEISDKLSETNLGIICLTAENKDKPWVLFEAGALSKGLPINRVCTLLIDIEPKDITAPLARFNHTILEKENFFQLILTINNSLGDDKIEKEILHDIYNDSWEKFHDKCQEIINNTKNNKDSLKTRTNDEIIADILNITRSLDKKFDFFVNNNEKLDFNLVPKDKLYEVIIKTNDKESIFEKLYETTYALSGYVFVEATEKISLIDNNIYIIYARFNVLDDNDFKEFINKIERLSYVSYVSISDISN